MCSLAYKDNSLFSMINYKPKQSIVVLQDELFETWVNLYNKLLVKSDVNIKIIDAKCRDFYCHAKEDFIKFLNLNDSEINKPEKFIELLEEANKLNQAMYWHFIFYIDECFETSNEKLIHQLQETRMLYDSLALDYLWKVYDKLINILERNYKIPKKVAQSSVTEEIIKMIENPNCISSYHSNIGRPIAWIILNGEPMTITGSDVKIIKDYLHKQDPFKNIEKESSSKDIINGIIGNKGDCKGKVRIILPQDYEDREKLNSLLEEKRYILVIPMTRPELILYFKNTIGIITDEGGLTCHAAIIAREMGIPCIVGTKVSTRILKDGDLVEVDADNGVINIIKR